MSAMIEVKREIRAGFSCTAPGRREMSCEPAECAIRHIRDLASAVSVCWAGAVSIARPARLVCRTRHRYGRKRSTSMRPVVLMLAAVLASAGTAWTSAMAVDSTAVGQVQLAQAPIRLDAPGGANQGG